MNGKKRAILYEMLGLLTGKNKQAIKMFFFRHRLCVETPEDFLHYLRKYEQKGKN